MFLSSRLRGDVISVVPDGVRYIAMEDKVDEFRLSVVGGLYDYRL